MPLLLTLLAACSGSSVGDSDCERVYLAVCNHQVDCELEPDFQSCDDKMREQYICDFDRTQEEYTACHEAEPSCTQPIAEECLVVLCSSLLGCVETVVDTDSQDL